MRIRVQLWSYFKERAGTSEFAIELPLGSRVGEALDAIYRLHPSLAPMRKSTLIAVGVDYQDSEFRLSPGDELSLFPPVQGG